MINKNDENDDIQRFRISIAIILKILHGNGGPNKIWITKKNHKQIQYLPRKLYCLLFSAKPTFIQMNKIM